MKQSAIHASITRAKAEDGPPILKLLSAAQLPVDGLLDHLDTAVVALADGRVVGCAALEVYTAGALLRSVVVDDSVIGPRDRNAPRDSSTGPGDRPWRAGDLPVDDHG